MLKKNPKKYFVSDKLTQASDLTHGFSTRQFGDLRPKPSLKENKKIDVFLKIFSLKKADLVLMEQIHGRKIKVVNQSHRAKIIPGVDGLITKEKDLVLGIKSADCLPILFFDPIARLIGVCHAGWQGVLKKIPQKMVEVMIKLGSLPENIIVVIGPHIGSCCYNVYQNRQIMFKKTFTNLERMLIKRKSQVFLDLALPTVNQLLHSGVSRGNIDLDELCTACQSKEFFSYHRQDRPEKYGAMLSIISLK